MSIENSFNNYIYLKRAISRILPLIIKRSGNLDVVSCSECIIVIPLLSSVDIYNYIVKCPHIVYTQDNKSNSLIINIV